MEMPIVSRPSKIKIHAQPPLLPMPFIFSIAYASKPPNEPARAAALKKIAWRMPNSLRLYQLKIG
jgi:hypothetical protein